MHSITNIQTIKNYLFAGNSTITLKSLITGKSFTFKVKIANKNEKSIYFVSLLNGPNNTSDYVYMGIISDNKDKFFLTNKSRITKDALSYKAFAFFFNCLMKKSIPDVLKVYHSGRCGRCGRLLTHADSIITGLGPECSKKMN